ncbi:sirohydrochlorin chelatase [Streptomyces hygroscopicus]|uniref:sirohydrochlorin chelatase n=1 Tax=Streptomyces hygroscopicus TaxID=1912 RepID=UPI001FCDB801|nr:CbiX/SirB N-terminal domain-containing protein [Streptomyces hygroscopicus]
MAHGSRNPEALRTVTALLDRVRALRPGLPVRLGHIELNRPVLTDTLAALRGEAVLVPLLLGRGYHIKQDIPDVAAAAPHLRILIATPLGPDPLLAEALHARLTEAGWSADTGRTAEAGRAPEAGRLAETGRTPETCRLPEAGRLADTGRAAETGRLADVSRLPETGRAPETGRPTTAGRATPTGLRTQTSLRTQTGPPAQPRPRPPAPAPHTAGVVLAAAGSRDPDAALDTARAAALLGARLGGVPVLPGYASGSGPTVSEAVRTLTALGHDRIAVASYFTAPGRFATECAEAAPGVVAAPLGAHPAVARLVLHRYEQALASAPLSHPAATVGV